MQEIEKLRLRMADLCSKSEQCEYDIQQKLLRKIDRVKTAEIIDFLKERRFIDDKRFACSFANDKVRFSRWGRKKISMALRAKRIKNEYIQLALSSIKDQDYSEALHAAATAKARSLNVGNKEDCQKLLRHLLSRGFESTPAIQEINNLRKSTIDADS